MTLVGDEGLRRLIRCYVCRQQAVEARSNRGRAAVQSDEGACTVNLMQVTRVRSVRRCRQRGAS